MEEKNIILAPSLLSCDFTIVGEQLELLKKGGYKYIHLDVMDGIFVPNISFGQPVIKSLRKLADMVFDVHLMITKPERFIDDYINCGADIITIHYESTENAEEILDYIQSKGKLAGLSVKPNTPAEEIFHLLPKCALVLVMTVEPGFGGQKFMADMMPKVAKIKAECERLGLSPLLEVDGGIDANTAKTAVAAGANMLVAGSSVFGQDDILLAADKIMSSLA